MTTERKLKFDEKTQLLNVEAVTKDSFSKEQVKNIYHDLEAKKANAEKMLAGFSELKFALIKVSKEPRLKEIIETILTISKFVKDGNLPDMETVEKSVKYWKETKEAIDKDMESLKPIILRIK